MDWFDICVEKFKFSKKPIVARTTKTTFPIKLLRALGQDL